MKSSFPKRVKSQSKKKSMLQIDVTMPMPSSEIMFWRRALHKYVYMHMYMYEKLFCQIQSTKFAKLYIGIASSLSGMAFKAFKKRALHMENCMALFNTSLCK